MTDVLQEEENYKDTEELPKAKNSGLKKESDPEPNSKDENTLVKKLKELFDATEYKIN